MSLDSQPFELTRTWGEIIGWSRKWEYQWNASSQWDSYPPERKYLERLCGVLSKHRDDPRMSQWVLANALSVLQVCIRSRSITRIGYDAVDTACVEFTLDDGGDRCTEWSVGRGYFRIHRLLTPTLSLSWTKNVGLQHLVTRNSILCSCRLPLAWCKICLKHLFSPLKVPAKL